MSILLLLMLSVMFYKSATWISKLYMYVITHKLLLKFFSKKTDEKSLYVVLYDLKEKRTHAYIPKSI